MAPRLRRTHTASAVTDDTIALASVDLSPHSGAESPSTIDQGAQRTGSLAQASWGSVDVRIPTFSLDDLPQDVYDKMERHPMVGLAVELKANVISRQGVKFIHDDPRVAAVCEAVWRPHHRTYIRNATRTGLNRGFCPFENVWSPALGTIHISYQPKSQDTGVPDVQNESLPPVQENFEGRLLAKLKPLQPRNVFGILIDGVENFCGYRLISPANATLRVEQGSCTHFTHNARWGNFFGEAELRRAYEAWYWQNILTLQWMRFFGRLASPVPVITFPAGYVTPDGKSAESIAREMGARLVKGDLPIITLPATGDLSQAQWAVDFQEIKAEADFLKAIEYFNAQILRALLMPDSVATTQGLSANRSIGEVHQDSFYAACDGYIEELVSPIEKQVAPLITLYNFGPDVVPPTVEIPPLDSDRKETMRQVAVMAARGGKLPIDWSALEELGIPIDRSALGAQGTSETQDPTSPDKGSSTIDAEQAQALRDEMLALAADMRSSASAARADAQQIRLERIFIEA